MATFQIHEDKGKENANRIQPEKLKKPVGGKNKRPTFAVLNNVVHPPRGQIGKTQNEKEKKKTGIPPPTGTENVGQKKTQWYKPSACSTFIEPSSESIKCPMCIEERENPEQQPTKPFSVYEDNKNEVQMDSKLDDTIVSVHSSTSEIRDPLKDITLRDEFLETPMSVGVDLSPMSIDKSQSKEPATEEINASFSVPRNDRERFFEIEEYQQDVLEYFREVEKRHRPKPNYMRRQPDINYSMRMILIDWLAEVAEEYHLHSETLHLTVSYIDRFLSLMSVVRAKLQLVGTAAMFIAAKYEEIYPPDVSEFVYITDDTYTKAQVLRMEQIILKILSFDLSVPSTLAFLNTYAVLHRIPDKVKNLAIYIAELSLLEGDPYLQHYPSEISSAALALARYTLKYPIWSLELEKTTTYSLEHLKDLILLLCNTHNTAQKLSQQGIQDKYKSTKYMEVGKIKPVQIDPKQFAIILEEYNESVRGVNKENLNKSEQVAENNENFNKKTLDLDEMIIDQVRKFAQCRTKESVVKK